MDTSYTAISSQKPTLYLLIACHLERAGGTVSIALRGRDGATGPRGSGPHAATVSAMDSCGSVLLGLLARGTSIHPVFIGVVQPAHRSHRSRRSSATHGTMVRAAARRPRAMMRTLRGDSLADVFIKTHIYCRE